MSLSYIGVTGFTRRSQVKEALDAFDTDQKKLMVGIVVTYKSLRRLPINLKWKKQIPDIETIADICIPDHRALYLAHYSGQTGAEKDVRDDVLQTVKIKGIQGVQLNIAWPEISLLKQLKAEIPGLYIVVQVGQIALEYCNKNVYEVVRKIAEYQNSADAILFDQSGGQGKSVDLLSAMIYLQAIQKNAPEITLGVAGGLGPGRLGVYRELQNALGPVNIDAQGNLRDEEGSLDIKKMKQYLCEAL